MGCFDQPAVWTHPPSYFSIYTMECPDGNTYTQRCHYGGGMVGFEMWKDKDGGEHVWKGRKMMWVPKKKILARQQPYFKRMLLLNRVKQTRMVDGNNMMGGN